MFGINNEFTCSKCNHKQKHQVGITKNYYVNDIKNKSYIPLNCRKCEKLHFIANKITNDNDIVPNDSPPHNKIFKYESKGVIAY